MVIAINTRILSGDTAAAKLLIRHFTGIAAIHTHHQFYFISNEESLTEPSLSNVKNIVIKQNTSSPLLWKLWYNYTLPAALKKIKADVLVSADGVCSLRTKLPQLLMINGLDFLHHGEWYNRHYARFVKSNLPLFLQKAKKVLVFSSVIKKELVSNFNAAENKIFIASFNKDERYQPAGWEQREKIKEKYTGGNEYFLYHGDIHNRANLTNLLKAFSLFKKRQKSSMQLLLLVDKVPPKNEFVESLRLYKYRDEVKLIESRDEEVAASITAAAWCAVNLSPLQTAVQFLQNALLCDTPAIAGDTGMAHELLAEAALYTNPSSIDSIAEKLMLVYKDENRRKELVEKGKRLAHRATAAIWENIAGLAGSPAL